MNAQRPPDDHSGVFIAWPALIAIIVYSSVIVIWGVRQEGRINSLEVHHAEMDRRIEDMDKHGTRQLTAITERLNFLETQLSLARQLSVNAMERANQIVVPNRAQRAYEDRW